MGKVKNILRNCAIIIAFMSCEKSPEKDNHDTFYLGGDLSYVNEMLDCGATYRLEGQVMDPYELFGQKGANISRIRLWHNPKWTKYSNYEDVETAIKRSKENGMAVLLDFHYSDTWADPQHQVIPEAWENISEINVLKDSLYAYTFNTLESLCKKGLTPEFVQVGNEVNIEIMQDSANMVTDTIQWERNLSLINSGLKAVEDFSDQRGVEIGTMIHIAQPENALSWFAKAKKFGIADFGWIGLSYYPKWSTFSLDSLGSALDSLTRTYDKEVMIVETAYPYTLKNYDEGRNILGEDSLIPDFPATPAGQRNFMSKLIEITAAAGGKGVIYWEPAWVSTDCQTLWNKGSNWENATFFDAENGNEALPIMDVLHQSN